MERGIDKIIQGEESGVRLRESETLISLSRLIVEDRKNIYVPQTESGVRSREV